MSPAPGHHAVPSSSDPLAGGRSRRGGPGGATALIVIGAITLVAAIVAAVLAVTAFVRVLPTDVFEDGDAPGADAVAFGELPGSTTVAVEADQAYVVWTTTDLASARHVIDDIAVDCGPEGSVAVGSPRITSDVTSGGRTTRTVGEFTAPAEGTCTVAVGSDHARGAFAVTRGEAFGEFFTAVGGTVLATLVAVGGGILGLGLLLGGIIWRALARRRTT